jgi:hypothetical protein
MVAGMSRDEFVARLVRAGELWMTGENPDEIRAALSPEFTFHAPGVEIDSQLVRSEPPSHSCGRGRSG